MAPRKSFESDKEKLDTEVEGEASKSSKVTNGKESSDSDEKNGKVEEENAPISDEEKDEEIINDDEDEDDESPIKKGTPLGKGKAKHVTKKKKSTGTKATPKKKKSNAKKALDEGEDEGNDEPAEYEVKEVIDSKKEKNSVYYLIRWKGYSATDDTWERATDLSCDDLIAAFNKKHQNKQTSSTASKQPPKKRKKEDEVVDPEKEYEVEKIISVLENKKGKVFRIRWKGFKSTQDTWEPEENLNCKDLIEKFLIKHKEQSQYSSKSLREDPKRTKRLVNETKNPRARSSKRSSAKARKTYYSEDDNSE